MANCLGTQFFTQHFLDTLPFTIVKDHFTYLGLIISQNPKHQFKLNCADMILKLKNKIEKWRILPLSMVGCNIAIKMLALSRFLYLFQNLPLFLTSKFFKQLDSIILPFVWGYKLPRISKAHLQKPVKEGGFGLPIFKNYYWAANGRALMYWQQAQSAEVPNNSPNGFTLKPQLYKSPPYVCCFSQRLNPLIN